MVTYKIICCNYYFDPYLIEVNENLDLLKVNRENLMKFFKLRNNWWTDGRWVFANWHHFTNDQNFHAFLMFCWLCNFEDLISSTIFWTGNVTYIVYYVCQKKELAFSITVIDLMKRGRNSLIVLIFFAIAVSYIFLRSLIISWTVYTQHMW